MIGTSSVKSMYLILKQHHFFSLEKWGGGVGGLRHPPAPPAPPSLNRDSVEAEANENALQSISRLHLLLDEMLRLSRRKRCSEICSANF